MPSQESVDNAPKQTKLDRAIDNIVRRYGSEVIKRAGVVDGMTPKSIPTGSLSLDLAIGVGGVPRGRVTEIYGPESSGKTALALSILAESQRLGGTAVFIDMEHILDLPYAARLGVNLDDLLLVQPKTGEEALGVMEALILSEEVDLIVLDPIAALVPHNEIDSDIGVDIRDWIPKLIDQAMRKLSGPIANTNTCVIFTNQLRTQLDVMFGNPEITTGGKPFRNWASVRLDMRRIQSIKVGPEIIGSRTRVRVIKNRLAPPFQKAEFDILFNEGISKLGDLLDLAVESEIITKKGPFYSYGDISIGQDRVNAVEFLRQQDKIATEIEHKVQQEILKTTEKSEDK